MNKEDMVLVQLPGGKVAGPVAVSKLREIKGFTLQTLVSFPGSNKWAPAFRILPLKNFFDGRFDIACINSGTRIPIVSPKPHRSPVRSSSPKAFIGKGSKKKSWVDRWLKRVATVNILFVAIIYSGWNYQPWRNALQQMFNPSIPAPLAPHIAALPVKTVIKKLPVPLKQTASPIRMAAYQKTKSSQKVLPHHPRRLPSKHISLI